MIESLVSRNSFLTAIRPVAYRVALLLSSLVFPYDASAKRNRPATTELGLPIQTQIPNTKEPRRAQSILNDVDLRLIVEPSGHCSGLSSDLSTAIRAL
jgi:hypothetical protein